jgi:hypothetical protein
MPRGISRIDEAMIQRRLWSPIILNPALWLDAADISTISVATGVSEWRDKSGFNRHAAQATGSLQPAYQATGLNGLPTINWGTVAFNSVGKVLYTPSFNIGTSNIAASFVVARANSGISNYVRILVNNSASPLGYSLWYLGSGNSANTLLSIAGTATVGTDITFSGITSPFIMASYANTGGLAASNLQTRLNGGSTVVTRTDATGTVGGTNQLVIGAVESAYPPAGTYSWQGVISEIVHFNSALTASQIQLIEGYLAWKWGIPPVSTHPYANRPPLIGDS